MFLAGICLWRLSLAGHGKDDVRNEMDDDFGISGKSSNLLLNNTAGTESIFPPILMPPAGYDKILFFVGFDVTRCCSICGGSADTSAHFHH